MNGTISRDTVALDRPLRRASSPWLRPARAPAKASSSARPWASDEALLGLSVWWVKATRLEASDITTEDATVLKDLQSRLQ